MGRKSREKKERKLAGVSKEQLYRDAFKAEKTEKARLEADLKQALVHLAALNREREKLRAVELSLVNKEGNFITMDSKTQAALEDLWAFRKKVLEKEGIQL